MRPCSAANAARCRGSPPPVAGVAGARRRRATSHCYYLHIGLAWAGEAKRSGTPEFVEWSSLEYGGVKLLEWSPKIE